MVSFDHSFVLLESRGRSEVRFVDIDLTCLTVFTGCLRSIFIDALLVHSRCLCDQLLERAVKI